MVVMQSRRKPLPGAPTVGRVLLGCVLWAGSCLLAGGPVAAQQDPVAMSKELYEAASNASTIEELNQVAARLEQARRGQLTEPTEKYLTNLHAWLLHKRGEVYMKQAAEAAAGPDGQASREWDARAMADFDVALQLDPKRWKSYHHRGVCRALAGQLEEASRDFTRAIELKADYASSWFNRGEIQYEIGQYARAVADYDEAIRLQPEDAGFHTSRGHARFQLRQFPQALEDYELALQLDPDNPEYLANRGEAMRSVGQWEQAAADFGRAIKLAPQYGRAYQSVAWLMATCPDQAYRNAELAVRAARKSIELDGDQDYIVLDTLAAAYANNGEFDKAQNALRRAIELAPPDNAAPLRERLELYRAGRPFRQSAPRTAGGSAAPTRTP